MITSSSSFPDSKQHLLVLDALRGIAAVMVLIMHTFEIFCEGNYHEMVVNHGYLAVDFFFMLSGYVMAHAYDDRWDRMTTWAFIKRRLIRLHPLIILGMTFGGIMFLFQDSTIFPKVADTTTLNLIFVVIVGYTLLPLPPSMDIRGWNEMHPLNGPGWSLFYEYIANILHVFILRRLSNLVLGILVLLAGINLYYVAMAGGSGDLIGGWSLEPEQIRMGFTRLLFPYMAGMLLRRTIKLRSGKNTFLLTSAMVIVALSIPRIGGTENLWMNGLYEALIISILFPAIIYLGAIGEVKGEMTKKVCTLLGDLSYPLYITHFPFILTFYAWAVNNGLTLEQAMPAAIGVMFLTILVAYASLKLYDLPVRKWLANRFLS